MLVTEVRPFAKNAKEHPEWHIEKIAGSIRAFGCKQPIVIGSDGTIVVGHGRFDAMTRLLGYSVMENRPATRKGETVIPYVIADDLTPDEIRAYRLADNQINAMTGIDMDLAAPELRELEAAGFDVDLIGFDRDDWQEAKPDDDAIPPLPATPRTKRGDVYELGNHRLVCGDSTDVNDIRKVTQGVWAQMVFTDPPYNVGYSGKGRNTSTGIMNDRLEDWKFSEMLVKAFAAADDVANPAAGWYVFHDPSTQAQFEAALSKAGLEVLYQLIWVKPCAGLGAGDYRKRHEPFFYACRKGAKPDFYGDRSHGTVIDLHTDDAALVAWAKAERKAMAEGKTTCWTFGRESGYVHPTQKPAALVAYALKNSSKRFDTVLDPFAGSGTVLVACERLGRRARLVELDPRFCDVIVQRWVDLTGGKPVLNGGVVEWKQTTPHDLAVDEPTAD